MVQKQGVAERIDRLKDAIKTFTKVPVHNFLEGKNDMPTEVMLHVRVSLF